MFLYTSNFFLRDKVKENEMIGFKVMILQCKRPSWANEMNFGMNHAPGAGLITHSVDLLSCSPAPYHYATTAPSVRFNYDTVWRKVS